MEHLDRLVIEARYLGEVKAANEEEALKIGRAWAHYEMDQPDSGILDVGEFTATLMSDDYVFRDAIDKIDWLDVKDHVDSAERAFLICQEHYQKKIAHMILENKKDV